MPTSRQMDRENVACPHERIIFSSKKQRLTDPARCCANTSLEHVMLGKKTPCYMIPLIRDVRIGKFTDREGDLSLPGRGSGWETGESWGWG